MASFDLKTRKPRVAQRSPFAVDVEAGKTYYWCSCGLSKNQPFCDGSHKESLFTPIAYAAPESKKVYFCGCKLTTNAPMCDGSHSKIPEENLGQQFAF